MAKEHPFGKLTSGQSYHDRMAARADAAFEEGKVNYLLKTFNYNVRKAAAQLCKLAEQTVGSPDLTFRAFHQQEPSFPLYLGASRLNGVQLHLEPTAMLPALFKAFGAAPFVQFYDQFYEANAERAGDRPVGLVFPRKGFKNGLVVYAADDPQIIPFCEREAFFTYVGGKKKDQHWVLVRSFQKVLEAVHNGGHGWRPQSA